MRNAENLNPESLACCSMVCSDTAKGARISTPLHLCGQTPHPPMQAASGFCLRPVSQTQPHGHASQPETIACWKSNRCSFSSPGVVTGSNLCTALAMNKCVVIFQTASSTEYLPDVSTTRTSPARTISLDLLST